MRIAVAVGLVVSIGCHDPAASPRAVGATPVTPVTPVTVDELGVPRLLVAGSLPALPAREFQRWVTQRVRAAALQQMSVAGHA